MYGVFISSIMARSDEGVAPHILYTNADEERRELLGVDLDYCRTHLVHEILQIFLPSRLTIDEGRGLSVDLVPKRRPVKRPTSPHR